MRAERDAVGPEQVAPGEAGALAGAGVAVARAPRRGGPARRFVLLVGPPIAVAGVVVGIWYLVTYFLFSPTQRFLVPAPHDVVKQGFLEWRNLKEILLVGLLPTTQVALTGLAIAIGIGMILAILMSQARWIERSVYPYAVLVQTIPIIAVVPVIGFIFSYSFKSRVIACVMISIFPIITNTLFGLKSADESLHDLFTLHGASRFTRLWKLQLPAALPAIFTGFRISAGLSVIGAIVGDFFFRQGNPGIGRLIDNYRARLASEELYTAVFFASLLGIVVFWGFGYIGNRVVRSWHESARERGKPARQVRGQGDGKSLFPKTAG
jgi:NitT/TauT family transport system permease protein